MCFQTRVNSGSGSKLSHVDAGGLQLPVTASPAGRGQARPRSGPRRGSQQRQAAHLEAAKRKAGAGILQQWRVTDAMQQRPAPSAWRAVQARRSEWPHARGSQGRERRRVDEASPHASSRETELRIHRHEHVLTASLRSVSAIPLGARSEQARASSTSFVALLLHCAKPAHHTAADSCGPSAMPAAAGALLSPVRHGADAVEHFRE